MSLRSSDYNIYVHLPKKDDYLIVQGYTGAIDLISGSVYKYLKNDSENESISPSTKEMLITRGYLTERSVHEERGRVKDLAAVFHRRHLQGAGIIFAPTFSCQLRCIYCTEASITHKENKYSQLVMTSEQVKSAYDAIDLLLDKGKKKAPEDITLFGGEPLMAKNYDIVNEIVEEGIRRNFHFKAITNGYDLMEYKDLLGNDKIGYLQITIDGPEDVHNKRRYAKGMLPTFDRICNGIQIALDQGCTVVVRTNVDRTNLNNLIDLNQFYIDQGWNKNSNFLPYAYITYNWLKNEVLTPIELLKAVENHFYEKKVNKIIRIDFDIGNSFNSLLGFKGIPSLRPYYCGSNIGSYIFGPDNNIYTCWDEVGLEEGIIGQYFPELVWNEERSKEWLNRTIANIPECLACPYCLICGGGCARQAKKTTGSMLSPYCLQFQDLFQYLIPTIYERYEEKLRAEQK